MIVGQSLKTAAVVEPRTLVEAKAHLRVDDSDDNDFITQLIPAARASVEAFVRRRMISQTWTLYLDCFPSIVRVPLAPVSGVTAVRYLDDAGTEQTLDSASYRAAIRAEPARIEPAYGLTWPSTQRVSEAVEIDVVVGYGAAGSDVEPALLAAMDLALAHFYEHREAAVFGSPKELPMGLQDLLLPHVFHG